jgi:hypothetical protein
VAVTILSVVPLTIGLSLVGWPSRTWPVMITTAKVVATVLAVAMFSAENPNLTDHGWDPNDPLFDVRKRNP